MFVDFNILNQLGSPSINSNTFANRPAAGQTGRLFVSTDTFEIYRDNGTGWDLIGGPGSSTVTGSGATGQVTYWTGTNTVSGENALFWDAAQNHLGINTATPTVALDVHSAADVALQLNGTGATPSIFQQFLSAGVSQYQVGYNWNASADYRRFSIYDSVGAKETITIDQQSRYVGINFQYSSLTDQPAYTLDVSGQIRGENLLVNSSGQNVLVSSFYDTGTDGSNIFIGGGGLLCDLGGGPSSNGSRNTSFGVDSLLANTTGYMNTAIGNTALSLVNTGYYNTAVGYNSAAYTTTGNNNVAIGWLSLNRNTTGSNNLAIGSNAGSYTSDGITFNTNSSTSVFIGNSTKSNSINESNQIVIGDSVTGGGTNSVTIGNSSITKTIIRSNLLVGTTVNSTFGIDLSGSKARLQSGVLSERVQVGTVNTINDATGVGQTLQFANYTAGAFITGSADSYIYKTASVFSGLSTQTLIFQTRSDVSGGGFAFVGTSSPIVITKIDGVSGNFTNTGSITTGAPTTGTAAAWKLGSRVAAAVVLDATQYIEVEVGGTFYKLAIVT